MQGGSSPKTRATCPLGEFGGWNGWKPHGLLLLNMISFHLFCLHKGRRHPATRPSGTQGRDSVPSSPRPMLQSMHSLSIYFACTTNVTFKFHQFGFSGQHHVIDNNAFSFMIIVVFAC